MKSSGDGRCSAYGKKLKLFDTMRLLTVLLDGEDTKRSAQQAIPPSVYMQLMSLTTEQRAAILTDPERGSEMITDHPSHLFHASPRIVVFQQFSPGHTYRVPLVVNNISSVLQCLEVLGASNPWFALECRDITCTRKLAPGMSVVYDVIFSPEERRDYKHRIMFVTGTETFVVPVYAIGPRPLLDLPDVVEVPRTAVKNRSSKRLHMRNVGQAPAVFSLSTKSPFTVQPQRGILAEKDVMQITIDFLSNDTGYFEEELFVVQETGEVLSLKLRGSAEPCIVRIEERTVRIEGTYLGLTKSKTFSINNDSDYITKFHWALYKDSERDRSELEKYGTSFEMMKNVEVVRRVGLEHRSICEPPTHKLTCQRVLADELSCLMHCTFPFRHPNYKLIPMKGEIRPHGTADITLVFEPDEIGVVEGSAYLEITGCEERIHINLQGTCAGPSMSLNVACADLGDIFLCVKQNYEVICGNNGGIPGTLIYSSKPSDSGGKIEVFPVRLKLEPGDFKSFNISFWSNRSGNFTERVSFVIEESLEVISILIKGSVIRPTLHFDKQSLDFGVTALGFATKRDVGLHNSSPVPVTFALTILQDGTQPALTHQEFTRSETGSALMEDPKEFAIVPNEGVVGPDSFQRIEITHTPNVVRTSQTVVRADMWNSDSGPITLPVTFSGRVASLFVRPFEILIKFCFINYPYTRTITIENKSDVEGSFYLPPQSVTSNSTVFFSLSAYQGYLRPWESRTISLKIITTALGRQKTQLSLHVFGERNLGPCCSLTCNGQGPDVTVQPTQLDWGQVRLLDRIKKRITLFNDSPIPAQFVARLHKKHSSWKVRPALGSLEPNESLELELSAYLRDAGKYSDKVDIEIANGRTIACSLNAIGTGTSIVFEPEMIPVFDMGPFLRNQDASVPITMTNKGTRHHRSAWTTALDFQLLRKSPTHVQERDKFTVDPHIVELPPNTSVVVHCKIRSKANDPVEEQWYFHGQIEGQKKQQVLGTSLFRATFTDPHVSFSRCKLNFWHDTVGSSTEARLTETLFVTNRSGLNLTARVNIDPPFEIVFDEEDDGVGSATIALHDGMETRIRVRFNARDIDSKNLYSRKFRRTLTFDYSTQREQLFGFLTLDKIKCVAELNYPNVSSLPKVSITLGCEVGSTVCNSLILANAGHLPVLYNFEILADNIASTSSSSDMMRYRQPNAEINGQSHIRNYPSVTTGGRGGGEKNNDGGENREERCKATGCLAEQDILGIGFAAPVQPNDGIPYPVVTGGTSDDGSDSTARILSGNQSVLLSKADMGEPGNRFGLILVDDIRDFILPITKRYLREATDIGLDDIRTCALGNPRERNSRIKILEVVPTEGSIRPNSSQYIHLHHDGSENANIRVKVVCRVQSGPSETVNVRAISDVIRYSIDKNRIDFHHQLFFEFCRETLTIVNNGAVKFSFEVRRAQNFPSNEVMPDRSGDNRRTRESLDMAQLTVEPTHGVVDSESQACLNITYFPGKPGPICETFDLEIAHHTPVPIRLEGYASLPQAYLDVLRGESFDRLPVDICYQAIGTLTVQLLIDIRSMSSVSRQLTEISGSTMHDDDPTPAYVPISEPERECLKAEGWDLACDAEVLPTPVDIEMAVERSLTCEFIRQYPCMLDARYSAEIMRAVPPFSVPEYIVDLGYVVIERAISCSAMVFNYGPAPIDIRLAKTESERLPNHSGIVVRFRNTKCLKVGESIPLHVTFHPRQFGYNEKRTDIEDTIHLEVTHGASIPIRVRAVATYPSLIARTTHLAFGEVAVTNCFVMPVLLYNDGCVPCKWEATINCTESCGSNEARGPFFIRYNTDTFPPSHENVLNVYFRPKECKHFVGQLRIQVDQSIFPVLVTLSGTGIAPDLHLSEKLLTFQPTLPYSRPSEKVFLVENVNSHTVEVFWRNFDTEIIEEERAIRILTHYYDVDEILLPPRQPGKKLSLVDHDFYRALSHDIMEMHTAYVRSSEPIVGEDRTDAGEAGGEMKEGGRGWKIETEGEEIKRLGIKNYAGRRDGLKKTKPSSSDGDSYFYDWRPDEIPDLLLGDTDRTEKLLQSYIDNLREEKHFVRRTEDPLRAVFEDAEIHLSPVNHSSPTQRFCIIFHGAPFTEYQRAACRLGRRTGVPVLNITDAILEVIASGNSACSDKLRKIIDDNYACLLANSEPYRSSSRTPSAAGNGEANIHGEATSLESPNDDKDTVTHWKYFLEPDIVDKLKEIPHSEKLESMDPLELYTSKIQSILLLQKIMTSTSTTTRGKTPREQGGNSTFDTGTRKNRDPGVQGLDTENTFLGMGYDLILAALEQRLSMEDYRFGFILQTLDNIFTRNERDTLLMLLSIVGSVGKLLFVTFYNTFDLYLNQKNKLVAARGTYPRAKRIPEEHGNKFRVPEGTARAGYENTTEDSKILYAPGTLAGKKADSLRRRAAFDRNLAKAVRREKIFPLLKAKSDVAGTAWAEIVESLLSRSVAAELVGKDLEALVVNTVGRTSEETYGEATESESAASSGGHAFSSHREGKFRNTWDFSADALWLERSNGLHEISRLMDAYQASLASLQPVLANWNPEARTYLETAARSDVKSKTDGTQDAMQESTGSKGFDVWYVAARDPWNVELYDTVALCLSKIEDIKITNDGWGKVHPQTTSIPQLYYVATRESYSPGPVSAQCDAAYTLIPAPDAPAAAESDITAYQEEMPQAEGVTNQVGSRESNIVSATTVTESLKPRWIMQPGEALRFKVQFAPKSIGIHKHEYQLSVASSNVTRQLVILGSADIPRLRVASENNFRKVNETRSQDDQNETPYSSLDMEFYDFGYILLAGSMEKRIHKRDARFYLSNISTLPAILTVFQIENSDDFGFSPDSLHIAPGKTSFLDLRAKVSKSGLHSNRLLLCVKNNPQTIAIQVSVANTYSFVDHGTGISFSLQSHGSELDVELDGRAVSFGKMLLWRKEKRIITVRNKSNVALYWKLGVADSSAESQVTLRPERGLVGPTATAAIDCHYHAKSVGAVKVAVPFRVFLEERDAEPLLTDFITITAESYDVQVDVINANPIDFKSVPVGSMVTEEFVIINRGPFDVGFIIEPEVPADSDKLELKVPASLIKTLAVDPSSGSVSAGNLTTVRIKFAPRKEFVVRNVPLFNCRLVDAREIAVVVAEIPILVSVSTYYTKVKIQPSSGLNFGYVTVLEKKTMYFDIENLGCFPFQYKIFGPKVLDDNMLGLSSIGVDKDEKDRNIEGKTRVDVPTSRSAKLVKPRHRDDRHTVSPRTDPFILSRTEGEVGTGMLETIAVQCCPLSAASFEEMLQVFVSNTEGGENCGEPVKLSVTGCIPTIDFCDIDAIFKENIMVESLTDFKCPRQIGPHSVFARKERCLYIRRVVPSNTYTARLHLRNPGFAFSDVTVTLRLDEPIAGDGKTTPFSVQPQKFRVAPTSTEIFTVAFAPTNPGIYAATLSVTLDLPLPYESPRLILKVCGESNLPEVVLLEPARSPPNDQIPIDFGRNLIGKTRRRSLSLKNIGIVEAKVIMEISTDEGGPFAFETDGRSGTRSRIRVGYERRLVRHLMPEEIFSVSVSFAPDEVGMYEGHVCIFIAGNLGQEVILAMLGESYDETVVLEGLESVESNIRMTSIGSSLSGEKALRTRKLSPVDSKDSNGRITIYKYDYGTCFLNEAKRIGFKITNRSEARSFRFDWGSHPSVTFSPSVGYLNERETKDIVATFFASEPTTDTQMRIECTINEITGPLEEGERETSWDDRYMDAYWTAGGAGGSASSKERIHTKEKTFGKVEKQIPEPIDRHIVPGSMRVIPVILGAIAAYSRYSCSVREIHLKDTFVFQSRRYSFTLANPGIVKMSYEWDLVRPNADYVSGLQRNLVLREVLRSLDDSCEPNSETKIGAKNRTLYRKDHENLLFSRFGSSAMDVEQELRRENFRRSDGAVALDQFVGLSSLSDGSGSDGRTEAGSLPFQVTPRTGILLPGECVACTLVFAPLDVSDYKLIAVCSMKNLDPSLIPLKVDVTARSLLPYCHFHLPKSDLSSTGESDAAPSLGLLEGSIGGPSVDTTKVVGFGAVGIDQTLVKKLRMTNPTGEDYHYSWRQCNAAAGLRCTGEMSRFCCVPAEGISEQGKQTEFMFTFLANNPGVYESLWLFSIDEYNLEMRFLFHARVVEPSTRSPPSRTNTVETALPYETDDGAHSERTYRTNGGKATIGAARDPSRRPEWSETASRDEAHAGEVTTAETGTGAFFATAESERGRVAGRHRVTSPSMTIPREGATLPKYSVASKIRRT